MKVQNFLNLDLRRRSLVKGKTIEFITAIKTEKSRRIS